MIEIDSVEELNALLEKNEKVLVLFYATWCPYCINFVPMFDKKIVNYIESLGRKPTDVSTIVIIHITLTTQEASKK